MSDTIYSRLKVAGTKGYLEEIPNPDYDAAVEGSLPTKPNTETKDDYLAGVVNKAVKDILHSHEVNQATQDAAETKQEEIENLNITSTIL